MHRISYKLWTRKHNKNDTEIKKKFSNMDHVSTFFSRNGNWPGVKCAFSKLSNIPDKQNYRLVLINNLNPVVYKTCVLREVEIKNRIRAQSRWSFRLNTGWRKLYFGYKSKTFSILFPWRTFSFIYKLENKVFLIFDVTAHASDQSLKLQKRKMMRGNIKSTFLKVSNILLRILSLKFFQFCL